MNLIGTKIAELRKFRSMTQEELSVRIGVSPQTVSKWETGTTCPDILLLPILADIFGVTPDELFGKPHAVQPLPVEDVPAEG